MARRRRKEVPQEPPVVVASIVTEEVESEDADDNESRIIARYKDRIKNPLTAIRAMCIECMGGGVKEVSDCTSDSCSLHKFRMGKNTMHSNYVEKA